MTPQNGDRTLFRLLRWGGVGLMLLALALSFTLTEPIRIKSAVVAVVGFTGWLLGGWAARFKPKA